MFLQTTSSSCSTQLKQLRLCSTSSYSKTSFGFKTFSSSSSILLHGNHRNNNNSIIANYIPQIYNYKKSDFERKPTPKWSIVYRRISLMENPEMGSAFVLNQLDKEGKNLSRWELCRVVKELRRFRRFKLALEVYEWMNEQGDKFTLSSSDAAIHLDLISKVLGIPSTEEYFSRLPETLKDKRTYGSLLNAYVRARLKEKAESLLEEMISKGYAMHPLPFNVMMTLYMKLRDYDKAISIVAQMLEKSIPLDIYTYNIWLTACGATGSTEKMEEVLELMKMDTTVDPNWTTYSTMATIYMNLGHLSKAKNNLRMVEGKITGRERIPFHYLLSLYGGIGEKEDVYRIWNTYKTSFPTIPNLGYHSMIASLVRLDDIEGAKKIYEEWLPLRSTYDPRICNLLIGWYVKNGLLEKAEDFVDQVLEAGGKVNAHTWEMLADGHIQKKQIPEVLSCIKEATMAEGGKTWRPSPTSVSQFLFLCVEESEMASKKAFLELLTRAGCLNDERYRSLISSNGEVDFGLKISVDKDETGSDNDDDSGADMLLNQLEGSF
ncbi:Pentatricopeptide repeat-containing protein [Thalictrum thalictroides]|uniref:Pentatricopeptide repeat-containing protein n=1 Tax=Thalictrum thalictroides TaxID=46969 RepID=A0A7J6VVA1_THATH|nr:Pentatricopeptide repeat-containing protein [Thalictrum thalictroides]